jgi:hypothetical protein
MNLINKVAIEVGAWTADVEARVNQCTLDSLDCRLSVDCKRVVCFKRIVAFLLHCCFAAATRHKQPLFPDRFKDVFKRHSMYRWHVMTRIVTPSTLNHVVVEALNCSINARRRRVVSLD